MPPTHCPFCQSQLGSMQDPPNPKWLMCPNSYPVNTASVKYYHHLFEYLCNNDNSINHYVYIIDKCQISFWPKNNSAWNFIAKAHLVLQSVDKGYPPFYNGPINFDFADFNNLDLIKQKLKLLSVFS